MRRPAGLAPGLPAWLFAVVMTPAWLLVLWLPVLCVGLWYALLAMAALASLAGMRRVPRVYPWQLDLTEVSRMAPRKRGVSPEARARARAAGARVGGD
ncbi:hypothetical protein [Streptomyces lydicus]|uniref:hypothetical protein n=1 Tax=Streptomyces lydicus TaxID=47763 RepID=UPI00341D20CB